MGKPALAVDWQHHDGGMRFESYEVFNLKQLMLWGIAPTESYALLRRYL